MNSLLAALLPPLLAFLHALYRDRHSQAKALKKRSSSCPWDGIVPSVQPAQLPHKAYNEAA